MRYDERYWTSWLVFWVAVAVVGACWLVGYVRRRHQRRRPQWTRWRGPQKLR